MRCSREIILIVFVLIIASCTGGGNGDTANVHTGTQSVEMSFYNLPSQVRSDQQMQVNVEVSNRGAEALPSGSLRVCLSGYDPYILPFGSPCQSPPTLDPKTEFNPEGSQPEYITWTSGINLPSTVRGSFTQDLRVTACYRYKTIANPSLCIDPENILGEPTKCRFQVQDLHGSQGAPIAVSSVEHTVSGGQINMKIVFENKGGGIPFASGVGIDSCSRLTLRDKDTVQVSRVMIGQTSLSCRPTGTIKLVNGRGFVYCEGPVTQSTYFITPATIELNYNYKKSMDSSIEIKVI